MVCCTRGRAEVRGLAAVAALTALTALLTGCSAGSGGAPAASPVTSSAGSGGPTGTASGPASAGSSAGSSLSAGASSPSSSAAPAPAVPVPRCSAGLLTVRLGVPEGAAGSVYVPVVFHNDGPRCELDGRPGMDATGPDGTVHAARNGFSSTGSGVVRRVVIPRGGDASAMVRASNVPSGSADTCPEPFTSVLVTPPDLTRSTRLAVRLPACPGLAIGPVVPGTAG